jgi:hypothetical protein
MKSPSSTDGSWNGRRLRVTPFAQSELSTTIRNAVERRAFRIAEDRGFAPGHQLDDWRCAESEISCPLNCGCLVLDEKIQMDADAASFDEGEIDICIEPRLLAICGHEHVSKLAQAAVQGKAELNNNRVFRFLQLPFAVDPSRVTARFRGRTVEIDLPRAQGDFRTAPVTNAA